MIPTIGCVGYATEQGLGRLAKDFYDHGVIQSMLIYDHPDGRRTQTEWYPSGTPRVSGRDWATNPRHRETVAQFVESVGIVLFFETPFDWNILPVLRKRNKRAVLVPMYEWTLLNPPYSFDKIICPSKLDQRYFPGAPYLPIPVASDRWKLRKRALRFLHNGGGIGSREHKGTRQLIEAIPFVKSPIEITIRAQNGAALQRIVNDNPASKSDPRVKWEFGEVPYDNLWDDHDVLVQPEKYNGLSLPLQEAFAAGMVVMTTDRFPMNDWLPRAPLIPVESTQQVQAARGHNWIEESIVNPREIARVIDLFYGEDVEDLSRAGAVYASRYNWGHLKELWVREIAW